jgi:hypothetical protein
MVVWAFATVDGCAVRTEGTPVLEEDAPEPECAPSLELRLVSVTVGAEGVHGEVNMLSPVVNVREAWDLGRPGTAVLGMLDRRSP